MLKTVVDVGVCVKGVCSVYMFGCAWVCVYIYIYVCVWTCECKCVFVYVCGCVFVYVCLPLSSQSTIIYYLG